MKDPEAGSSRMAFGVDLSIYMDMCYTYAHKGSSGWSPTIIHMRFCSLKDQNQELAFTGSRPYRTLHSLVEFSPLEAVVQTLEQ